MEKITKRGGRFYYGEARCGSVEDAYRRFRDDYNASVGKEFYHRLDRLGQRKERIHGFGFRFAYWAAPDGDKFVNYHPVRYRMLGLVGISYSRILGALDVVDVKDEDFEAWFDWAFSFNAKRTALRLEHRKDGTGRTSKRLNARYR